MQVARKILLCSMINHNNILRPYRHFPTASQDHCQSSECSSAYTSQNSSGDIPRYFLNTLQK